MAENPKNPDQSAQFVELVSAHHRDLYAFVRMICRNREIVEDVFQQALLVIWQRSDSFEVGTDFKSWACQIARFVAMEAARDQAKRSQILDPQLMDELLDLVAAEAPKSDRRVGALRRCLALLSPAHRRIIERRYADGELVVEIAKAEQRSPNSISVTLHTLRKKLAECIRIRMAKGEDD